MFNITNDQIDSIINGNMDSYKTIVYLVAGLLVLLLNLNLTSSHKTINDLRQIRPSDDFSLLLVSTLNGELVAIERSSGVVRWTRQETPVLKVPSVKGGVSFLPDPKDGSLYVYSQSTPPSSPESSNRSGRTSIKKLPFTIPQLVSASPCRSSDGILYTGQKADVWYAIDVKTGEKKETISFAGSDKVCPHSKDGVLLIGRSEYHISMFDSTTGDKRWNASFCDYAAETVMADSLNDYDLVHLTSSERGKIMTFDKHTGDFMWDAELSSPIVAVYLVDPSRVDSTMKRLPFTSIAHRTMEDIETKLIRKTWRSYLLEQWDEAALYPALYIGEENELQVYALPAMVDSSVARIPSDGIRGVPLLEGPGNNAGNSNGKQGDRMMYFTGYYDIPDRVFTSLIPRKQIEFSWERRQHTPHALDTNRQDANVIQVDSLASREKSTQTASSSSTPDDLFQQQISYQIMWIKIALATLVSLVIGVLYYHFAVVKKQLSVHSSSRNVNLRISGETGNPVRELEMSENGDYVIGKIIFRASDQIGSGGNGTVVFKGKFDGRDVAVKRILPVCYSLAFREVKLLRETDDHPNVVRYFCMEEDAHFYYIALELCSATLADYVENPRFDRRNLKPLDVMHQAVCGVQHLHSLNIAHRDIKPQNILISQANQGGNLKVMISDFGLCKKLAQGDRSFSKKSGVLGTEGWIAPEVLFDSDRVTKAIDIFSLGCVFYFILSEGQHPFGDSLDRQSNIRRAKSDLSALSDKKHATAMALISQMLNIDARLRPNATQVAKHPTFWNNKQRLDFFQDISDFIEKESTSSPIVRSLEKHSWKVINSNNWIDQITQELQNDLRRFRSYKGNSVRDLLRALRNKKHHYRELPVELQKELGTVPDEFVDYFTSRFPYLLIHSYCAIQSFKCESDLLAHHYAPDPVPCELMNHPDITADEEMSWQEWKNKRLAAAKIPPLVREPIVENPEITTTVDDIKDLLSANECVPLWRRRTSTPVRNVEPNIDQIFEVEKIGVIPASEDQRPLEETECVQDENTHINGIVSTCDTAQPEETTPKTGKSRKRRKR